MAKTMSINLGARLHEVRRAAGLTQRELARRAGITNGTISLIETDKLNPTVGLLKGLLDVLQMSLSEFFRDDEGLDNQIFFKANELLELGSGEVSIRQVGTNLEGRTLQICHERYTAGSDSGKSLLRHNGEEGGIIIEGQIEIMVGEQTKLLGPGDAYYFRSNLPHRFRNTENRDCVIVSAICPPSF